MRFLEFFFWYYLLAMVLCLRVHHVAKQETRRCDPQEDDLDEIPL